MANGKFASGMEALLSGLDLTSADIRTAIVDEDDWTVNFSTDRFLDDVPGGAIVATSAAMTGKTVVDGTFDAANTTIASAPTDTNGALLIYNHTGTASTSVLICYFDTGTGLLITTNGGDVVANWHASGIFTL